MKKSYTYTTQRGAEVKLEVEVIHITKEENLADHNVINTVSRYEYKVASITVAGKSYNGEFANLAYDIKVGMQGTQPILVAVPSEIIADFHAAEKIEAEEKVNRMLASEKRYQEERAIVVNAMNM